MLKLRLDVNTLNQPRQTSEQAVQNLQASLGHAPAVTLERRFCSSATRAPVHTHRLAAATASYVMSVQTDDMKNISGALKLGAHWPLICIPWMQYWFEPCFMSCFSPRPPLIYCCVLRVDIASSAQSTTQQVRKSADLLRTTVSARSRPTTLQNMISYSIF